MGEGSAPPWVSDNWLSYHLAVVPIGTLLATTLLLLLTGSEWQWWGNQANLMLAGQLAPFGAAVYGTAMFLAERVGRMFWALAQRKRDIEKGRQEGRQEGREEREQELIRQLNATGQVVLGNVRLRVESPEISGDMTASNQDNSANQD